MRSVIFLLALTITALSVHAQTLVGVKYDVNGMPLNGYFDPILYAPDKQISKTHYADSYEVGYYFTKAGKKVTGQIKYKDKKILFKKGSSEYKDKITPEEVQTFVIGVDSFFTISKYYYQNTLKTQPVYVQYIAEFGDYTVAKHYHFRSLTMSGSSPIVASYLIKSSKDDTWQNFSTNKKFDQNTTKYFEDVPVLSQKIADGDYKKSDIKSIIKMAEYYGKYTNGTPIFYDKFWQEVRDTTNAKYKALITNVTDSVWTLQYFQDSIKLYEGNYASFAPHEKEGDFTAYYPDGQERQIVTFVNKKPKETKVFYENGVLYKHYTTTKYETTTGTVGHTEVKYQAVNDTLGNPILKDKGASTLRVKDPKNGKIYVHTFQNQMLTSVYRMYKRDTLFQITNPNYDFKIGSLQKKFSYFMDDATYNKALSVNAQGTILVSFMIDTKGYVKKSTVLNKIHPELDKLLARFIQTKLLAAASSPHKFKPYKVGKVKKSYEVVVPFDFGINRFYRAPVGYDFHMHNMMFQQQMMMNSFSPSIPTGF